MMGRLVIPRRSRYRRRRNPTAIRLTARDIDILKHVYRHRFLRSSHIISLVGGSKQKLQYRLESLFDHGYLERVPEPRDPKDLRRTINNPYIYALGNRGATLLREEHGVATAKKSKGSNWRAKNRQAGFKLVRHDLLVADFMVRVELAVRSEKNLELIRFDEILAQADKKTQTSQHPRRWRIEVPDRRSRKAVAVEPDGIFGLRFLDTPPGKKARAFFFVETDLSSMPVLRSDFRQTSFCKKLLAYHHSWQHWRRHPEESPFGFVNARVLSAAISRERIETFITHAEEVTAGVGLGMFLFTTHKEIESATDFLTLRWINAHRQQTSLLD